MTERIEGGWYLTEGSDYFIYDYDPPVVGQHFLSYRYLYELTFIEYQGRNHLGENYLCVFRYAGPANAYSCFVKRVNVCSNGEIQTNIQGKILRDGDGLFAPFFIRDERVNIDYPISIVDITSLSSPPFTDLIGIEVEAEFDLFDRNKPQAKAGTVRRAPVVVPADE